MQEADFICKWFSVQTFLCSLEFMIQINLEHDTITVWNLARSWSISKYQKGNWKKNIQFLLEQQKMRPPRQLTQLSGWTRYFRHRHITKLYKNKMDPKVIKSYQCSLERSHAVLIEVNSELWSRSSPF